MRHQKNSDSLLTVIHCVTATHLFFNLSDISKHAELSICQNFQYLLHCRVSESPICQGAKRGARTTAKKCRDGV